MLRRIFLYGVLAGLIVAVPMNVALALSGHDSAGGSMVFGYACMLLALSLVFLAVKRQRDDAQGGVIKFLPALGMGLAISAVAGVLYVAAWEISLATVQRDFAASYSNSIITAAEARGESGEALARLTAEMRSFEEQYSNPLFRLPMTFLEIFPVGVIVSLISAALLRNPRFMPARR